MLPTLIVLLSLAVSVLASESADNVAKELSREVQEEFSGRDYRDELEFLKKQFSSTHPRNDTLIRIPNELNINHNHTLFEGDIHLTPEQWKAALDIDPSTRRRRQAIYNLTQMWQPMGAPVIPYMFVQGFRELLGTIAYLGSKTVIRKNSSLPPEYSLTSTQYQQVVKDAMAFWSSRTCVRFRQAMNNDNAFIIFNHNAAGCSSSVGRRKGGQYVNLEAPLCMTNSIITHELSHVFGTLHMQSRVDRDSYVQIDLTNVEQGMDHNFAMEPSGFSTYGLPYEYGSIMHYFPYAFSIDPELPTIYAKADFLRYQGSMDGPQATFWDTQLINKMYKCTDKCAKQMPCYNGGVTDGASCSKCFCPKGWAGTYCETRPTNAQVINVDTTVQKVKLEFGVMEKGFEEKLVILQAPAGKRMEAIVNSFGPHRFPGCRNIGLEIVPYTDTRSAQLRFCGQVPYPSKPIYTDGNTMLFWLYRDINLPVTVEVSVRAF
ncbi:hypothetical protein PRIPAC_95908 [Pristionchus pacificus]|uniref:Zinc metalloproteinase n=1 Tax=Pristionchus pacificus TaxID=54126 RepID=A0A2A6D1K8_PRIPA|nr:hypothetical protein PRIPAC_95908 [Pristionchus pacificus]|eukprot:PDM84269.1 metallopeptidase [Pristionchus pacificus]